jgi:hypothetical protein
MSTVIQGTAAKPRQLTRSLTPGVRELNASGGALFFNKFYDGFESQALLVIPNSTIAVSNATLGRYSRCLNTH